MKTKPNPNEAASLPPVLDVHTAHQQQPDERSLTLVINQQAYGRGDDYALSL